MSEHLEKHERDGGSDAAEACGASQALRVEMELSIQDGWRLCEQITRTEARNFYYGLKLLPHAERTALFVVYAWMRVIDDIADDESASVESRTQELDFVERGTRAAFGRDWYRSAANSLQTDGGLTREEYVLLALAQEVVLRKLSIDDFLAAIEGQRMDLTARVYQSFEETALYCDRVASTVGRICLDVWGVRDMRDAARARELSTARGIAFQLTNILRDIREDHARGRCYLPADELAAHGLTVESLLAWNDDRRCAAFMREQCARAGRYFDESASLEAIVSTKAVSTLTAMSVIYRRILEKIASDPRRALEKRVSLSTFEKISIGLRARFGLLRIASAGSRETGGSA
ncbi:MAG: phytoene/squalene synthase family protein [Limnohabitans sp.]|jgi:phytoene synthase|nr:phytoene/squalene synthase family protein [Limnohabitans sp.]